jgi:hypothetical protein
LSCRFQTVWRNPEELRMELAGLGSIQPYASLCNMSKGAYISHAQYRLLGPAIRSFSTRSMILFAACRCRLLGLASLLLRLSDYKVLANMGHNLVISHLVGCFDSANASAQVIFLKTFFQLAFRLTRTQYQNRI